MQKALYRLWCIVHYGLMQHADIIKLDRISDIVSATGRPEITVRSWRQRNSIPGEYWAKIVDLGLASYEQLAATAPQRKLPDQRSAA